LKSLNPIRLSGREVLPLIEGGKGISVSNGESSGAWSATGGVGTFSAVNADAIDEQGNLVPIIYKGQTRRERHRELIEFGIRGGITQAKIAHERSNGQGRLHMNVLWEMAAVEDILHGILDKVSYSKLWDLLLPYRFLRACLSSFMEAGLSQISRVVGSCCV
jgi:nitronate monooxygenase